jgi:hypothetical protein
MKYSIGDIFLFNFEGRIVIGKICKALKGECMYEVLYSNNKFKERNGDNTHNLFAYDSPIAQMSQIMSEEEAKAALV